MQRFISMIIIWIFTFDKTNATIERNESVEWRFYLSIRFDSCWMSLNIEFHNNLLQLQCALEIGCDLVHLPRIPFANYIISGYKDGT